MNQYLIVLLFVVLLPLNAVCQVSNEDLKTMLIVRDLERESRPSRSANTGLLVVGDTHYSPTWDSGSITLYREDKTYKLSAMKYEMLDFSLDILIDGKLKSLTGDHVKSFDFADSLTGIPHRFVNGKDYTRNDVPIHGFLEILCWGKLDVFSFTEVSVTDPNYNVILNTGSENYHVNKKRTLIYGPGVDLRPVSTKELTTLWDERAEEMKKFQRINKLRLSSERDLLLMVDYFNTL